MKWKVTADPERWESAVKWFRKRVAVPEPEMAALKRAAASASKFVGAAAQMSAVQHALDALDKAQAAGVAFAEFKATLKAQLADEAKRVKAAVSTTLQTAYSTGRWYALQYSGVTLALPYFLYDAVIDVRTTAVCRSLNGIILRHDDPYWRTHWTPMHWACRSNVRAIGVDEATRRGITRAPPAEPSIPDGFGLAPPMRSGPWQPDPSDYAPELWHEYVRKLAMLNRDNKSS